MQSRPNDLRAQQFEKSRRAFEQNMVGFLNTELELAKTFVNLARTGGEARTLSLRSGARKVYDTVLYFLEKARLSEAERQSFVVGLEALKSDLEML